MIRDYQNLYSRCQSVEKPNYNRKHTFRSR
jgi:hypothetical protein